MLKFVLVFMEELAKKICSAYLDSNTVIIKDIPVQKHELLIENVQKNLSDCSHDYHFLNFHDLVSKDLSEVEMKIWSAKNLFLHNFYLEKEGIDTKKIVFVNFLLRQYSKNHGGFQKQLVFFAPKSEKSSDEAALIFSESTGVKTKRHPYLSWGNIYSLKDYNIN